MVYCRITRPLNTAPSTIIRYTNTPLPGNCSCETVSVRYPGSAGVLSSYTRFPDRSNISSRTSPACAGIKLNVTSCRKGLGRGEKKETSPAPASLNCRSTGIRVSRPVSSDKYASGLIIRLLSDNTSDSLAGCSALTPTRKTTGSASEKERSCGSNHNRRSRPSL